MDPVKRPVFDCRLTLRPLPGQSPTVCRLRLILKALLKRHGLENMGMTIAPLEALESTGNEEGK